MKRSLDRYFGTLTPVRIAEGMNAAQQNARRLVKDAKVLFDGGRYPSALALAILSIEESGKQSILRGLALARDEKELKAAWRDYRSHTKKNVLWGLRDMLMKGARRAHDFAGLFDSDAEHTYILDNVKQICFYTDCLGNCHWSVPEQIIERDLTSSLLKMAESLANGREVKTEEIELWIQYMKPSWKSTMAAMENALFEWDKELRRRGLAEGPDTMEGFFRKGILSPLDPKDHQ